MFFCTYWLSFSVITTSGLIYVSYGLNKNIVSQKEMLDLDTQKLDDTLFVLISTINLANNFLIDKKESQAELFNKQYKKSVLQSE